MLAFESLFLWGKPKIIIHTVRLVKITSLPTSPNCRNRLEVAVNLIFYYFSNSIFSNSFVFSSSSSSFDVCAHACDSITFYRGCAVYHTGIQCGIPCVRLPLFGRDPLRLRTKTSVQNVIASTIAIKIKTNDG